MRRIALASITLAVQFCLSDHTVAVQSATVDRVDCELFDILNALKVGLKSGKHGDNCDGERVRKGADLAAPECNLESELFPTDRTDSQLD